MRRWTSCTTRWRSSKRNSPPERLFRSGEKITSENVFMRIRNFLIAAAFVAAAAAPGVAQVSAAKAAWAKGPEQFLMTNEEKAAWSQLKDDAAAQAFIDQFWARRGAQYHADFDAKVKYADEHFKGGRARGALSDRGRMLILFGTPTRVTQQGGQQSNDQFSGATTTSGDTGFHENETKSQTWVYDGDAAQRAFGVQHAEITFTDQFGNGEYRMSNSRGVDINAAQQRAIAASMTQAAAAPAAAPRPAAAPAPQPTAPAVPADALKTQALRDAIAAQKAGSSTLKKGSVVDAEFVSPSGDFYVPVGIIVPKGEGVTADAYDTLF